MSVKDRKGMIGGSSWGDILELERWHCARRLYYDFAGTAPDFEEQPTRAMERGNDLEGVILTKFYDRFQPRDLIGDAEDIESRGMREDFPDWWNGHLDAASFGLGRREGWGVIEAKSVNRNRWFKFQESGLPISWRAQVLHYMPLIGARWGILALFCADPDIWQLECLDIERDETLLQKMRRAGDRFVARVEAHDPPPGWTAKDYEDPQAPCGDCKYRQTCLGPVRAESAELARVRIAGRRDLPVLTSHPALEAALRRRDQLAAGAKSVKAEQVQVEAEIDGILSGLGHPEGVVLAGRKVTHLEYLGKPRLDQKALEQKYPDAYNACLIPGKASKRWHFGNGNGGDDE